MKMTALKPICAILALLLLTACSGTPSETETPSDTSAPAVTSQSGSETEPLNIPPVKNYNGRTFTILAADKRNELFDAEMTGDVVDDAVFNRNLHTEDHLGIKLKYDLHDSSSGSAATVYKNLITSSIMSDEAIYDIMTGAMTVIPSLATEKIFTNVLDMDIDLSNPWWVGQLENTAAINGCLYALAGDLSSTLYNATAVVYFNTTLQNNYSLGNFYSLVRDGNWTLDKLLELSSGVTDDLNGDGVYNTENDRIAIISHVTPFGTIQASMELELFGIDNGVPTYRGLTYRFVTCYDKLRNAYDTSLCFVTNGPTYEELSVPFREDRNLFYISALSLTTALRDMKSDYGILPMPKYDADQENYISPVSMSTVLWAVPVTAPDLQLTAEFSEIFCYLSAKEVMPAYYEVALQDKYSRDADTRDMLQIIRSGLRLNADGYLDRCFKTRPFSALNNMLKDNTNPASYVAAAEEAWKAELKAVIEAYSK